MLEAHAAGVVTSATIMANAPGFEHAVRCLRTAGVSLGVGVHLNLVQGRSLTAAPSLTDPRTGKLYPLGSLALRAFTGRIAPEDITAECAAQIDRVAGEGIAITHVDSHRHTHALPAVWRPMAVAALSRGVRLARWPAESLTVDPANLAADARKLAIAGLWGVARRRAPALRHPDAFVGISLMGGTRLLPRLLRVLDTLRPGTTELMVHVGRVDAELAAKDPYTWQREHELDALTSAALRGRLGRGDIELVHFGALA
ncbi:MAG: carbohydrate deacetylase [Gemmatimonadaceae bacterium]